MNIKNLLDAYPAGTKKYKIIADSQVCGILYTDSDTNSQYPSASVWIGQVHDSVKKAADMTQKSCELDKHYKYEHPELGKFEIYCDTSYPWHGPVEDCIQGITIYNKKFKTKQNLGIGNTLDDVKNIYGEPTSYYTNYNSLEWALYETPMLAWGYNYKDTSKTITSITLLQPKQQLD